MRFNQINNNKFTIPGQFWLINHDTPGNASFDILDGNVELANDQVAPIIVAGKWVYHFKEETYITVVEDSAISNVECESVVEYKFD